MDTEDKLQKQILQRLEKLNEQWLDNDDYERRVKKSKPGKRKSESNQSDTGISWSQETESRRKKKKRRKYEQKKCEDNVTAEVIKTKTAKGEKKHLQDLKLSLGLTECDLKNKLCDKESEEVKTNSNQQGPEIVIFNDPGKKKQQNRKAQRPSFDKRESVEEDQPEFDMKKARFEVQKVGIKGFSGSAKDDAMTSYLVKLGAKLPKNKFYNYKEFLDLRKQEKESAKEKKAQDRELGYKVKSSRQEKKRSKDRNDVGVVDGQVGRYKDGVQYINKKELKGFKGKKKR